MPKGPMLSNEDWIWFESTFFAVGRSQCKNSSNIKDPNAFGAP